MPTTIDRTKELLQQLQDGINKVQSSYEFKRVLMTMSKFRSYSFNNCMLIFLQKPTSTRVAGFRTWVKLGRSVKKGEKAIWIFAPMNVKRKNDDGKDDEEETITIFKPVPVFDLSQTEGEEIPTLKMNPIANSHEELLHRLRELSGKMKIEILFEELSSMEGVSRIGQVVIDSRKNPTEQAIILIHELAHEMIHDTIQTRLKLSKEQKEMEAEAVAYVVSQQLDLPETNSDKYLALYHKSYDLQESLKVIHQASQEIIKLLNQTDRSITSDEFHAEAIA